MRFPGCPLFFRGKYGGLDRFGTALLEITPIIAGEVFPAVIVAGGVMPGFFHSALLAKCTIFGRDFYRAEQQKGDVIAWMNKHI